MKENALLSLCDCSSPASFVELGVGGAWVKVDGDVEIQVFIIFYFLFFFFIISIFYCVSFSLYFFHSSFLLFSLLHRDSNSTKQTSPTSPPPPAKTPPNFIHPIISWREERKEEREGRQQ